MPTTYDPDPPFEDDLKRADSTYASNGEILENPGQANRNQESWAEWKTIVDKKIYIHATSPSGVVPPYEFYIPDIFPIVKLKHALEIQHMWKGVKLSLGGMTTSLILTDAGQKSRQYYHTETPLSGPPDPHYNSFSSSFFTGEGSSITPTDASSPFYTLAFGDKHQFASFEKLIFPDLNKYTSYVSIGRALNYNKSLDVAVDALSYVPADDKAAIKAAYSTTETDKDLNLESLVALPLYFYIEGYPYSFATNERDLSTSGDSSGVVTLKMKDGTDYTFSCAYVADYASAVTIEALSYSDHNDSTGVRVWDEITGALTGSLTDR